MAWFRCGSQVNSDLTKVIKLGSKTFNGGATWSVAHIQGYKNFTNANFTNCDFTGQVEIYNAGSPSLTTTHSYNASTGVLSVYASGNAGGIGSLTGQWATVNPVLII